MNTKSIARNGIIAALYIVFTIINPFSYGNIQFRISEILVLLVFFRKDYMLGLIVGCIIANFFSPLGWIDVVFGTLATVIALVAVMNSKRLYIAAVFPVVVNGLVIGFELYLVEKLPFILSAVQVAFGELVVMIVGVIIFTILKREKDFLKLIDANQNF